MLKRVFCVVFALIVLTCAVLPTFAEEIIYSMTYNIAYNGAVDQGVNTLQTYYDHYRAALDAYSTSIYYFELMYLEMGISRPSNPYYYVTNTNGILSWGLPWDAYNSVTYESSKPIVRFYVPDSTWEFEIRLSDGTQTLFRSSDQSPTLTDLNVYYYEFTVSLNQISSSSNGWYIYSNDIASSYQPNPTVPADQYDVTFNYQNSSGQTISTQTVVVNSSSNSVDVTIPTLNNYIINSASGSGTFISPNIYRFPFLLSDQIVNVNVSTIQESLDQAYNRGYQSGYQFGFNAYPLSPEYDAAIDSAYDAGVDRGYSDGYEDGYLNGSEDTSDVVVIEPIENPLSWATGPVVAFLNIELWPGLSLGILFFAGISVALVVIFLKLFAGG